MPRSSRAKPPSPFHRFNPSPEVIRLVVLMYVRFPLSLRNVEDLLFERGIDICHETVRLWWNRFGPIFAGEIRPQRVNRMRGFRHWRWHLDEMYVKLNGEMIYLWRAVDHEGEVLESYVSKTRDKAAALVFMRKALKRHGPPEKIITGGLRSYGAAMNELGCGEKQETGRWANNRVENSHLPFRRRERAMNRFRRMSSLQKFASVYANLHNHFNLERHLVDGQTYKERRSAPGRMADHRELAPCPLSSTHSVEGAVRLRLTARAGALAHTIVPSRTPDTWVAYERPDAIPDYISSSALHTGSAYDPYAGASVPLEPQPLRGHDRSP